LTGTEKVRSRNYPFVIARRAGPAHAYDVAS